MAYGKAIQLFLVDGTTEGLITAELSNWNGFGIKISRTELPDCNRPQIQWPGVYFLICKGDGSKDSVYIGESENVKERLLQHLKAYQKEEEKYLQLLSGISFIRIYMFLLLLLDCLLLLYIVFWVLYLRFALLRKYMNV